MFDKRFTPATLAMVLALAAPWSAHAAQGQLTAQQQRMKSCNAQASSEHMKGEERRGFMSQCLKGEANGKKLTAQQEKMATCSHEASAKQLKGTERQDFMRQCLRAKPSAATGR